MIAKKVANPKKSATKAERAGGLANYITAPERENGLEKCIHFEAVNFMTKTFAGQKAEMIALSQEAVKSKDPVDHWVLSWRHDEHPTPAQAKEAVETFIEHCGLKDHQYIWGLHDDTKNMHVHIQVNRVHPDTLKVTKINKGFDREASQQAIALIEHAQGWKQEAGARYDIEDGKPVKRDQAAKQLEPSNKAKAMELQTGEKSAQRTGIEAAAPIITSAKSWKELHEQMAAAGMQYERKGSGAIIHVGDVPVKASDISRAASLSAMQKLLGPYQPPREINKNEYHDTSRNFTNANAKKPHTFEIGKDAGYGLRNLSQCTLAHSQKSKQAGRTGVLQLDARPDRRATSGLRRDTGRDDTGGAGRTYSNARRFGREGGSIAITEKITQPIRPWQHGWKEYIAIRDTQKAAKNHDTTELQKRHGTERAALAVKLKAERDAIFSGSWKGKGDARNALQSVLATQQAALKLELSERQKTERKALQAQYKPLPMYKQWKEQPQIVSEAVRPALDQRIERERQPLALVEILKSLSHRIDTRGHVTYQSAGRDVFRDEGRTIQVLDLKSDRGIAAAIATAQQKFGPVLTLTGSPEFKQNAVTVAVANGLTCRFADPALDALRDRLQAERYQAERTAATERAAVERAARAAAAPAKAMNASFTPPRTQSEPSREAEPLPAPEKHEHLNATEHALVQRIAAAIQSGDVKELTACHGRLGSVKRQAAQALAAVAPQTVNPVAIEHQVKIEQNEAARRNGQPEPWYMSGIGEKIGACAWDRIAEDKAKESTAHLKTDRPAGIFKKKEAQAWDEKIAALQKDAANWKSAASQMREEIREKTEQRVAKETQATATRNHQNAPEHAKQLGRHASLAQLENRLEASLEPVREKARQRQREPDHGMGM